MRVTETMIEELGPGRYRITTLVETVANLGVAPALDSDDSTAAVRLGEGPTKDTVPDRIVKTLIAHRPTPMKLSQLQVEVGGNARTVNRQAWTLATNAADLQIRLRGWVVSPDRGWYSLSSAAQDLLDSHGS